MLFLVIFNRSQRVRLHHVCIEAALKVVNLVLEDPRIPTFGVNDALFSTFVQAGHSD